MSRWRYLPSLPPSSPAYSPHCGLGFFNARLLTILRLILLISPENNLPLPERAPVPGMCSRCVQQAHLPLQGGSRRPGFRVWWEPSSPASRQTPHFRQRRSGWGCHNPPSPQHPTAPASRLRPPAWMRMVKKSAAKGSGCCSATEIQGVLTTLLFFTLRGTLIIYKAPNELLSMPGMCCFSLCSPSHLSL